MGTHTEEGWRGNGRWYDTKMKRLSGFGIGACRLLTGRAKEKGMASLTLAFEDGYIRFGHGHIGFMVRKGVVEYVTLEGHYEELDCAIFSDLFDSSEVMYQISNDAHAVLAVSSTGSRVYRFSMDQVDYKVALDIQRTDLLDEGFDYCDFKELHLEKHGVEGILLTYEFGAGFFSSLGTLMWHYQSDSILVKPEVCRAMLVYHDYSGTVSFDVLTGSRIA